MRPFVEPVLGWNTVCGAIDGGHVHMLENGTAIVLDGRLVPKNHASGFDNPCASIPFYPGYPIASVPTRQSGDEVPTGLCIYGKQWGEAKFIHVAFTMDDLVQWKATCCITILILP
jgi:amidase